MVRRGKPTSSSLERFEPYAVDGVTIWKARDVCPANPDSDIHIDVRRFLWIQRLIAKGVETSARCD